MPTLVRTTREHAYTPFFLPPSPNLLLPAALFLVFPWSFSLLSFLLRSRPRGTSFFPSLPFSCLSSSLEGCILLDYNRVNAKTAIRRVSLWQRCPGIVFRFSRVSSLKIAFNLQLIYLMIFVFRYPRYGGREKSNRRETISTFTFKGIPH